MPAAPATITAWLTAELDKKLATLPTDQEKYRYLILSGNVWRQKYDAFATFGRQPFGAPHPIYGYMDSFDFSLLLADIDLRKTRLERVPA